MAISLVAPNSRYLCFPDLKTRGLGSSDLVLYTHPEGTGQDLPTSHNCEEASGVLGLCLHHPILCFCPHTVPVPLF